MSTLRRLNARDFDSVVADTTPVLVDFYTDWCGPCRMLAPVLETLAVELKDRLTITKVNLEEEGSLGARFQVSAVPTMMLFKDGNVLDTIVGMPHPDALRRRLESHLPAPVKAASRS